MNTCTLNWGLDNGIVFQPEFIDSSKLNRIAKGDAKIIFILLRECAMCSVRRMVAESSRAPTPANQRQW